MGTPNIRVRFLPFAFRFLLVFFAFRFLAMRLPPGFILAGVEYRRQTKTASADIALILRTLREFARQTPLQLY
jgi:hypothetical protein